MEPAFNAGTEENVADLDAPYRQLLKSEFLARRSSNRSYSQNAFARFLRLDPTYLSKLMRGKILLSLDLADGITRRLKLSPDRRRDFILSAAEEQRCHALYLLDPELTDCDPALDETNLAPKARSAGLPRRRA